MRRSQGIAATLLLALAGAVWSQGIEVDFSGGTCSPRAGDSVAVLVYSAPEGAGIYWGDGSSRQEISAGDGGYSHAFAAYGEYTVELLDESGTVLDSALVPVFEYLLTPSHGSLSIGEALTVTVEALPGDAMISDFGELDWGDGATEEAKTSGDYTHAYAAAGSYTVELFEPATPCFFAAVDIEVRVPVVAVDPAGPRIDEPLVATVDREPIGGTLDWGNGESAALDGSGSYELAGGYSSDGAFSIRVLTAAGAPAASAAVDVAAPRLELDDNSVSIGEQVTATISGGPEGGSLAWGDGASESGLLGEEVLSHAYASAGSYQIRLARANGEPLLDASVGVDAATFDVSPSQANTGERIGAVVSGEPAGGAIDWGDGEQTLLDGSGSYGHYYDAAGEYRLALLDGTLAEQASRFVSISQPQLFLDTPTARLGEPVVADFELVGTAIIDWGDGASSEVSGSGSEFHRYAGGGDFVVELRREGALLASEGLSVLEPVLALISPGSAAIGESVVVSVSDAPFEAELDWGDGEGPVGVSDGDHHHSYGSSGSFAVRLVDAWQGRVVGEVSLTVAEVRETISVDDVSYDAVAGEIAVHLTLSDLAVGQNYTLSGGGAVEFLEEVASQEMVDLTFLAEGTHTLELTRQSTGEVRAALDVEVEWPRASESLIVVEAPPYLEGDFIEFELQGLNPEYTYVLRLDDPSGFERVLQGEEEWSEIGHYRLPGSYLPSLTVQYPGGFGASEVRASQHIDIAPRSGTIAIAGNDMPYGLDTVLELGELIPGANYRVDFGDGEIEEFEALSESQELRHRYTRLPGAITLESFIRGGGIWDLVDSATPPMGLTFTGGVELADGGTVVGSSQRFIARGLAPASSYEIRILSEAPAGEIVATSGVLLSSESGEIEAAIEIPDDGRLVEQATGLFAELRLQFEPGVQAQVDRLNFHLPPLQRTLGEYVVEITALPRPFTLAHWTIDGFDARGVVREMTLAGRIQGDVEFTFDGYYRAHLTEPLELALPARLQGLDLDLSRLTLAARVAGFDPSFAGSGSLEGLSFEFGSSGFAGSSDDTGSFFSETFDRTGELLLPVTFSGAVRIGETGWQVADSDGSGAFVIDLSQSSQYRMQSADGSGLAIEEAYEGWDLAGRSPDSDPASDGWTGVLFLPTHQNTVSRDPALYAEAQSRAFVDSPVDTVPVAWTAGGFQLHYRGNDLSQYARWDVEVLSSYRMAVADSQIVMEEPALLQFHLPFFDKPYVLGVKPTGSGDRSTTVVSRMPIARDFGTAAVIADQPRFVVAGDGSAALAFDRAAWTIDQEFAADGSSLDATLASSMKRDAAEAGDLPAGLRSSYEDTLAALDTAENLLRLQLPLDGLAIAPGGGVSLSGSTWKTLAKAPELDMYGFPYLSGADAEIGIKRVGDEYALGLRGGLALGGLVRATAAPAWYHTRNGREVRWVFDGVSVGFGDLYNVVPTPVSFNLTVGGLVSLDDDDASLEFNGAGQLTVGLDGGGGSSAGPSGLNIEAGGVFGINDSSAEEEPYWLVYASVDLAEMGTPIPVKVKGVDIFAFYLFRGGIGHNLRLDQRTGNAANDTCAVDDGFVGPSDDARPSVLKNALQCFDDDNELALLAGTVIGWHQSRASDIYGLIWHLNANMTMNSSGQVILAGRGWAMKPLDFGYRLDATPNMVGRISGDENAVLGSFCLGNVGRSIGELDCSGLEAVSLRVGGLRLLEAEANAELRASWSSGEYFFALGRETDPVDMYVFPSYTNGYFVAGNISSSGIVDAPLPANGVWASLRRGMSWDWSYTEDAVLCAFSAHATAHFGFSGAIGVDLSPSYGFDGQLGASAGANAGVTCGELDTSVGVSMSAYGRIVAPDPFSFSGSVRVTAEMPVIGDLDVTVHGVTADL